MNRDIAFVTNGPLAKALGISDERLQEIEGAVQAIIVRNGSIRDVVMHLNERRDLTDAEWTSAIFALGYFYGARSR